MKMDCETRADSDAGAGTAGGGRLAAVGAGGTTGPVCVAGTGYAVKPPGRLRVRVKLALMRLDEPGVVVRLICGGASSVDVGCARLRVSV